MIEREQRCEATAGHEPAAGRPKRGARCALIGLALAEQLSGGDAVTACFFGEGAVAEGEFHESLNLAALWRLPVLFLCENNRYAMGTALERSGSETHIMRKAASYNVPAACVDGMDVLAVEAAVAGAVGSIREGCGPQFLELATYRFRAHSMFDPELYRDKAEVEEWKKRGPIVTFVARLREAQLLSDAELETDVYTSPSAGAASRPRSEPS